MTDEQGRYEMSGLNPGRYHVEASKPGYGAERLDNVEISEGRVANGIDFVLPSGGAIRGVIADAKGKAIFPAYIIVFQKGGMGPAPRNLAQTDRNGAYIVSGLRQGTYEVKAWATNFAGVTKTRVEVVPGEETQLDITLTPGGAIEATILDADGNPVKGVPLDLVRLHGDGEAEQYFVPKDQRESDVQGGVRVKCVPPGEYLLRVVAEKEPKASEKVNVAEGQVTHVEIVLPTEGDDPVE